MLFLPFYGDCLPSSSGGSALPLMEPEPQHSLYCRFRYCGPWPCSAVHLCDLLPIQGCGYWEKRSIRGCLPRRQQSMFVAQHQPWIPENDVNYFGYGSWGRDRQFKLHNYCIRNWHPTPRRFGNLGDVNNNLASNVPGTACGLIVNGTKTNPYNCTGGLTVSAGGFSIVALGLGHTSRQHAQLHNVG